MAGWYMHGRNTYKRYMVRELTSVAVAYYALLVLYGLFQLHAGPEAFDGFIASLRSPLWMIINLATLALVAGLALVVRLALVGALAGSHHVFGFLVQVVGLAVRTG